MADSHDMKDILFRVAVKVDALRAAALTGLEVVTQARQVRLQQEQARLSRKLGAEHPHVMTIGARLEHGMMQLRDLKIEIARAETVEPTVGPDEWALHGYVRWKDLSPAPDLTVALVDAQGRWVQALGFACTDVRGYFRLVASIGRAERAGEAAPPAMAAPPSKVEANIRVMDRNRVQLYRGEEPALISPGGVEYREIVLEDGGGCSSPEEDVTRPAPENKDRPPAADKRRRRRS